LSASLRLAAKVEILRRADPTHAALVEELLDRLLSTHAGSDVLDGTG
jgi:hypothetical protein